MTAQFVRAGSRTSARSAKSVGPELVSRLLSAEVMRFTKQVLLLNCILAACVTTNEPSTAEVDLALDESACTAKEATFDNYYAVRECEKLNPGRVQASIGALVAAGGTCTATDESKNCVSIEPIEDKPTLELSYTAKFSCGGTYCRWTPEGVWKCTAQPACCTNTDEQFCIPIPVLI